LRLPDPGARLPWRRHAQPCRAGADKLRHLAPPPQPCRSL
jgi:hypothetical protein